MGVPCCKPSRSDDKSIISHRHHPHHHSSPSGHLLRTAEIFVTQAGAGLVNGIYHKSGTHKDRPLFKQTHSSSSSSSCRTTTTSTASTTTSPTSGSSLVTSSSVDSKAAAAALCSIIFFDGCWKLNNVHDTSSWLYYAPDSFQHSPPGGVWATHPDYRGKIDPPPQLSDHEEMVVPASLEKHRNPNPWKDGWRKELDAVDHLLPELEFDSARLKQLLDKKRAQPDHYQFEVKKVDKVVENHEVVVEDEYLVGYTKSGTELERENLLHVEHRFSQRRFQAGPRADMILEEPVLVPSCAPSRDWKDAFQAQAELGDWEGKTPQRPSPCQRGQKRANSKRKNRSKQRIIPRPPGPKEMATLLTRMSIINKTGKYH